MPEASISPARILIVDDEQQIRGMLHTLLGEVYQCVEAASAEASLELLHTEQFNLILTDIIMGGMSGLEMVAQVRQLAPETMVIMISAEQTISNAIEAMRAGAFDYISKPFNLQQVTIAVRRALDHQALREANRQSEERFRQIVEHATDIIYRTDVNGRFTLVNPIAVSLMKRPVEGLIGLHYLELVRPDYRADAEEFYRQQFNTKLANTYYEFPAVAGNGADVWLGQNVQLLVEGDRVVGFQAVAREVTRQRFYDTTTGLPNRALFEGQLAQTLTAEHGEQTPVVMLLSPDRFKRFVDTLGHASADRLLHDIAKRLTRCVGGNNLHARFGDDEFSILLTQASGAEDVTQMAERICEALKEPFRLDAHDLYVTASIGIAQSPQDGDDAQALMKNAGAALFRAKEQGGNNYQFYAAEMNVIAFSRLSLESSMRRALEREEFTIHYQPKSDINTGGLTGMEALVRWQHPEKGLVSPGEFIPLAEDTGMIVPLDEWVLRTACTQNKAWQEAGFQPLRVSSNLSARSFQQPDLVAMVARVLEETGLAPNYLDLELTESSVMKNAEATIKTLNALKATGVHISIDDFGTGYSSLNYIKRFPVHYLKIDQSFVRDATTEPNDAAIVMAIITLAHSLNLKVIAEGVETEEQSRFLRLLRCDEMQGYLLSKPLPAEEFRRRFLDPG